MMIMPIKQTHSYKYSIDSIIYISIFCLFDTLTIFQVRAFEVKCLAWFGHGLCKLVDFDSFIRLSCSFSDLLSASLHLFSRSRSSWRLGWSFWGLAHITSSSRVVAKKCNVSQQWVTVVLSYLS